MPPPSLPPTRSRRPAVLLTLLVAAVVGAYANTFGVPFVYDDLLSIPGNPSLARPGSLAELLFPAVAPGATVSGRPVLNLSFALNHALSGTAVWSYHGFNLLVHLGSALLLFGIVRRTLALSGRPGREPRARRFSADAVPLAAVIAALWALHPLQTQAVTYTVQRAESLMGGLLLLTLYAFIRAAQTAGPPAARWQALSVAACALGMGTKEVMAVAPLLVLLYDRTFLAGSFRAAWRERRGRHLALAATWLLLAALVLGTGGNRGGTVGIGTGIAWWAYPVTQFKAVAHYLALAAWPHPLVFEYGTLWVRRAADFLPHAALVLPLLAGTALALRRQPALGFCGAWFFLILAPTSLAPGTIQMIVEHRMYLPLAAPLALGVLAVHGRLGRAAPAVGVLAALALGALTYQRNHDYRSPLALWADTVAKRPDNPRAHGGLAEALEQLDRPEEALRHRQEAVRLEPGDPTQVFNLALTLERLGRTDEALRRYRETLELFPGEARTHNNLALLLARSGDEAGALRHYAEAVRLQPAEPLYRQNHGFALLRARRPAEALAEYRSALAIRPEAAEAQFGAGSALAALDRPGEAVAHFEHALRLAPDHAAARFKLGNALLDTDRVAEAAQQFEAGLKLSPDDAEMHHNLGVARARLEQWREAQAAFERALRLRPDYPEARRNLEQLRALLGLPPAR